MECINLEEYKKYLVNNYRHECDNNEKSINKRISLLNKKYNDEYLESIINGTYTFANKIVEISEKDYYGYIKQPLQIEPDIVYIDLDLTGGYKSDTIVSDSENDFYSIGLLEEIFGNLFIIDPCKIEITEEFEGDDDFLIMSEIPTYYLYIQCKKEIIDNAKKKLITKK